MSFCRRMYGIAACLAAVAAMTVTSRAVAGEKGASPQVIKTMVDPKSGATLTITTDPEYMDPAGLIQEVDPTNESYYDVAQPHGPGACATPVLIYQNEVTNLGNFAIPGSVGDGGAFASDDITLAGEARLLCNYSIRTFNATGTYNLEIEWFTGCPAPHGTPAGVAVAGTLGTFNAVPAGAGQILTVTPATPVVLGLNTYHVRVRNIGTQAFGWTLMGQAEVGTTADLFALWNGTDDACNFFFGGPPNHAGFRINVNAATGPGACCLATGACVSGPDATQCAAAGGQYQGDGSLCANVVCAGACCQVGTCTLETGANCLNLNGVFKGLGVACAAANCVAECATDGARCHARDNVNGRTSNLTVFNSAEDFIPSAGFTSVNQVCVWGSYASSVPLPVSSFRVRYFTSVNGLPGAVLATFTEGTNLTVTGPAPTGSALAGGGEIYNWNLAHAPVGVTPGQCHWVEVTNSTTATWFWSTSADGNSYWVQDGAPPDGYDYGDVVSDAGINLAYCLNNATNNFVIDNANQDQCVTGACILSTCPFTCINNATAAGCAAAALAASGNAANASFTPGISCIETNAQPVVCCRGDMDGNGAYNGRDIQSFARAIRDWVASENCQGNDVQFCRANVNEDFILSAADVPGFVTLILNSGETNDRCCGAPLVSLTAGVQSVIVMDNTTATTTLDDAGFSCGTPAGSRMEGEVYVRFVAPAATILVSTNGNVAPANDSIVQVMAGQCGSFVSLGCDDDSGDGFLSNICVSGLNIGDTYYIGLASFDAGAQGAYNVALTSPCPTGSCCVGNVCSVTSDTDCRTAGGVFIAGGACGAGTTCPNAANVAPGIAGDTCAAALPIACGQVHTATPSVQGYVSNSVPDAGGTDPASTCEVANGGPFTHDADWYYIFTAPAGTTRMALIMCGLTNAAEDTILTVWGPNSNCATFPQVGCDDDTCTAPAFGPSVTTGINVTAGSTYIIRVQHYTPASAAGTTYTVGVMCQQ